MGKIRGFLGIFVSLFTTILTANAFAAGYVCNDIKAYTSCSTGYYMTTSDSTSDFDASGAWCLSCDEADGVDTYCPGSKESPVYKLVLDQNSATTNANITTLWFQESPRRFCTDPTNCAGTVITQLSGAQLPTRVGYEFGGYSNDAKYGDGDIYIPNTGNIDENADVDTDYILSHPTWYAQWKAVSYDCAAGTYWNATEAQCQTCTGGSYCPGVTGVNDGTDQGRESCPNESSSNAGAQNTNDCYINITFNSNGGAGTCTQSMTCNLMGLCNLPVWDTEECNLTNGSKVFIGWNTDASSTIGVLSLKKPTNNMTLYAIWADTECEATNGDAVPVTSQNNTPTCKVTCHDGYQSSGTYTGDAGNTKLQYTCSGKTIAVDYAENNGSDVANGSCTYGETLTLPSAPDRTGYTFTGWKLANGTMATAGETIACNSAPLGTADGTSTAITAEWTANTYYVVFNNTADGATTRQEFTYDVAEDLDANTFTNPGYNFLGWSKTRGGDRAYSDKQNVKNLAVGGDYNLYTIWSDAEVYQIDYTNIDGATHSNPTAYTVNDAIEFTEASKQGYAFKGWYIDSTPVDRITVGTTGNKEIRAEWTACNSQIDGDCGCESGTHPVDGVCTGCSVACSTLGGEYQGTYNACANDGAGNAETQCYTQCTTKSYCKKNSDLCPGDGCGYNTMKTYYGVKYYNSNVCVSSPDNPNEEFCPITQARCNNNTYFTPVDDLENGKCMPCSELNAGFNLSNYSEATSEIGAKACYKITNLPCTPPVCPLEERGTCDYDAEHYVSGGGFLYYPGDGVPRPGSAGAYVCPGTSGVQSLADWACFTGYDKNISDYANPLDPQPEELCVPHIYTITLADHNSDTYIYQKYKTGWYGDPETLNELEKAPVPTRKGYTFQGFFTDLTGGSIVIDVGGYLPASDTYTSDTILYTHWAINNYTITYNMDGGDNSEENPATYTVEDNVTLAQPSKRGYMFNGWFSDSGFNTKVTEIAAGTTGNKEFWAKWTPIDYTITYNMDGGDNSEENPATYTVEDNVTLAQPSKRGYMFNGWFSDSGFNTQVTEIATGTTGNKEFWAKWTPIDYTITYNLNGGDNSEENPATYNIEQTPLTLESPTKLGYMFNGWSGNIITDSKTIPAGTAANINVTANWTPIVYTIKFDANGGTTSATTLTCEYDDKNCVVQYAAIWTNHDFTGWKSAYNKDYQQGDTLTSLMTSMAQAGVTETTLTASWNQRKLNCKTDVGAGKYYNGVEILTCPGGAYCPGNNEDVNEGSEGCIYDCPAGGATSESGATAISQCRKTVSGASADQEFGYGTATWNCGYTSGTGDNALYQESCIVEEVLTCDAGYYYKAELGNNACSRVDNGYYSPAPTVTDGERDSTSLIAYACPEKTAANDGIGSAAPYAHVTDCYTTCALTTSDVDHSVTVTPDDSKSFFVSDGGYPACSYTVQCATGYTAQNGTSPICKANKYSVVLNMNNGSGTIAESVTCEFDSGACTLPATSSLNRPGYVSSNKWCTNADGTGTCYIAGQSTDKNISANGTNTTLHATWAPAVFKIDLVADDATSNANQSPVYLKYTVGWFSDKDANNAIATMTNLPTKNNWVFMGYKLNGVTIIDDKGYLQTTPAALSVTTNDARASVIWTEGATTCEAGYYYSYDAESGMDGVCKPCTAGHWCKGGDFATNFETAGLATCPSYALADGTVITGTTDGGITATSESACYVKGLSTYVSTTGWARGTQTCNYNADTQKYDAQCRDYDVKTCVAGYYYESGDDCVSVGKNYYSDTDDKNRYACPDNGTTGNVTTANNIYECYKTVEYMASYGVGTQVCNYTSKNPDGSAKYATSCTSQHIDTCATGYYLANGTDTDCAPVGKNYYSGQNEIERHICPTDNSTGLSGITNSETAGTAAECYIEHNPFTTEHGAGKQRCDCNSATLKYDMCSNRVFETCQPGYYWNKTDNLDCVPVGYGYFGPVNDSVTNYPTARQGCATFDGRNGQTETETSPDASACFMTDIPCTVEHGGGLKTCNFDAGANEYSADCMTCQLNICDERYHLNNNRCEICPANSICGPQTRTGNNGVANAEPQLCNTLFDGRYPESDAGSVDVAQCFGSCDMLSNVKTMVGRDYQGTMMMDTCEIKQCNSQYYLESNKSQCTLCPKNSVCGAESGSDMDLDGTPDSTPTTCAILTNGTHPLSDTGSTKIDECYAKCVDYPILGGMAIRDTDTVQYGTTCTYHGVSETNNPCEIRTIKGAETCVETSCNYDYELVDGHCQRCEREHADGYKPNGNCLVAACKGEFHPDGDQCVENTVSCSVPNAISASRQWDEKRGAFGVCKITECAENYHIESNTCVPDTQVCSIEHGVGTRTWNHSRNTWGECIATSCDAGYTNDKYDSYEPNKPCGRCKNAVSSLGQLAVSTYIQGCEIGACLYQGELYTLENNECVPICPVDEPYMDDTGSMLWNNRTKKCEQTCNEGYMPW